MERINYRITLDAHKNGIQRTLQGFETADTMARRISINLTSGGDTYEIPFDHVTAVMYVTTPSAAEPSIEACTIEDNTVIYDVLPIAEEGITEMQLKLIKTSMEGAKGVLISPRFAVEITESNTSDNGATQTPTFTALENALAKAQAVYDSRVIGVEINEDCTFRVLYADGAAYESDVLRELLYDGNVHLAESWAKGSTGVRSGEDTNNSMYFSNVSRSAAEDAEMINEDARELLNEAIKHTTFTSFLVDFENGNLNYMSPNSNFNINENNGDLEYTLPNNYDPETLIGEVVDEYVKEQSEKLDENLAKLDDLDDKLKEVDAKTFGGEEVSYFAPISELTKYLLLAGGKLSGSLEIEKTDNTEAKYGLKNALGEVYICVSEDGKIGLYDVTHSKWLVVVDREGNVDYAQGTIGGARPITADDFTISDDELILEWL